MARRTTRKPLLGSRTLLRCLAKPRKDANNADLWITDPASCTTLMVYENGIGNGKNRWHMAISGARNEVPCAVSLTHVYEIIDSFRNAIKLQN